MDVKTEITKVLKDVQASAREFASLGLQSGSKAVGAARGHLTKLEENLKRQADKLKSTDQTPADTSK